MPSQFEVMADGHADSVALRLTRLACGKKQAAQDSLLLAMQNDSALRLAVERAGVRHFIRGALATYADLMRTGGPYLAAHPEEARS